MPHELSRRDFARSSAAFGAGGVVLVAGAGVLAQPSPEAKPVKPPALAPELVKAFVGAGHGDLEKVKAMLAEQPRLMDCVWDWGGGDYESALGGAGHMGRVEIAEYLLAQGHRPELHAAAMLGQIDVVKALFSASNPVVGPNLGTELVGPVLPPGPGMFGCRGPHGISLIAHAAKGGERARAVAAWLAEIGC